MNRPADFGCRLVGFATAICISTRIRHKYVTLGYGVGSGVRGVSFREGPYFAILGKVNFERFSVVFEARRGHRKQNIFSIHGLPLLLLAFF